MEGIIYNICILDPNNVNINDLLSCQYTHIKVIINMQFSN